MLKNFILEFILYKNKNLSNDEKDKLVNNIVKQLEESGEIEIKSNRLGELVMDSLKRLDEVAFVRFASVYKNFENTNDFKKFIGKIATQ